MKWKEFILKSIKIVVLAFLAGYALIINLNLIAFKKVSYTLITSARLDYSKFIIPICKKAERDKKEKLLKLCKTEEATVKKFPKSWMDVDATDLLSYNNFKTLENILLIEYFFAYYNTDNSFIGQLKAKIKEENKR